jgi:hypothetical protein
MASRCGARWKEMIHEHCRARQARRKDDCQCLGWKKGNNMHLLKEREGRSREGWTLGNIRIPCIDDEDNITTSQKETSAIALSLSLSLSVQEPAFEIDSPKCKTLSLKRPSEGDPNAEFSLKRWSERDPNTIPLRLPLVQEQFQIEPHAADSTTSRGP